MTKENTYCVPIIHAYSIEDLCRWPLEHSQTDECSQMTRYEYISMRTKKKPEEKKMMNIKKKN
jgi:hypothetical protein